MDDVVKTLLNGVDTLLKIPTGCGEQTMISLAPTVYSMMYLKQTQQITEYSEVIGNKYIRDGKDIITFRLYMLLLLSVRRFDDDRQSVRVVCPHITTFMTFV